MISVSGFGVRGLLISQSAEASVREQQAHLTQLNTQRAQSLAQLASSQRRIAQAQAGLVIPTRIKQWTFYRRNEERVREAKKALQGSL